MVKAKVSFICQECDFQSPKWLGKCPQCQSWNSFAEALPPAFEMQAQTPLNELRTSFRAVIPGDSVFYDKAHTWPSLQALQESPVETHTRFSTGIEELNRVLGGGLIRDSFTLLGGDPGIGKSTLLLQMCQGLLKKQPDLKLLYVSGEESIPQMKNRAQRLGLPASSQLFFGAETQIEKVFLGVKELQPHLLIVDSIQTFSTASIPGAPGSMNQVREVTTRLMTLAKTAGIAIWLVGHVTKEGTIAGPKTVEHMVDTVLYFEGEGGYPYRLLRTVKNRFGNTRELGVFEMDGEGLREVANPSQLFLNDRKEALPGVAITCSLEGSRPLLVELQALVTPSGLAMPRRTAVGFDHSRISLLAAILEKHLKLPLAQQDLFFNVVGGLKLSEPACDLAAAMAIWSSIAEKPIPTGWLCLGEVGLTGEMRRVSQLELRLQEAHRLGFQTAIIPENTPTTLLEKIKKQHSMRLILLGRIERLRNFFS